MHDVSRRHTLACAFDSQKPRNTKKQTLDLHSPRDTPNSGSCFRIHWRACIFYDYFRLNGIFYFFCLFRLYFILAGPLIFFFIYRYFLYSVFSPLGDDPSNLWDQLTEVRKKVPCPILDWDDSFWRC